MSVSRTPSPKICLVGQNLLEWRPWGEKTSRGRLQMLWKDDIKKASGINVMQVAKGRVQWLSLKEAFIKLVDYG